MSEPLSLHAVIGFGGSVENGLLVHPDGKTLIYPLGSTIVLRDKHDPRSQEFLQGHTDKVSVVYSIAASWQCHPAPPSSVVLLLSDVVQGGMQAC